MRIGFALQLLDGSWLPVDVPEPGASLTDAEALFEQGCRAIATEYYARLKAGGDARPWVQKAGYEFLSFLISHGFERVFEERIKRLDRDPKCSTHVNPFQRGLLAIFAHEKGLMDEGDRELFGKRLWYAYRHYVPPCFLTCFLKEVWSHDPKGKAAAKYIEPEFEQWIWFERARDPNPKPRGRYSAEIEEKVAFIKKFVPIVASSRDAHDRFQVQQDRLIDEEWPD